MKDKQQRQKTNAPQKLKAGVWLFNAVIFAFVAYSAIYFQFIVSSKNRAEIDALADAAASRYGVQPALVKAIIWKESRYRIHSVGRAGEIGLMQLHTTAINEWCQRTGKPQPSRIELFEPKRNIEIGTWYLAWTGSHWRGYKSALLLQISEYNAGYGNVSKGWKPASPQKEVTLKDITIPSTRNYVKKVMEHMEED